MIGCDKALVHEKFSREGDSTLLAYISRKLSPTSPVMMWNMRFGVIMMASCPNKLGEDDFMIMRE